MPLRPSCRPSLALASSYPKRNTRRKAERGVPLGAVGRNKPAVHLDTLSITPFILTNRRTVLPVLLLAATISHAHVGGVVYPIFELPPSQLPDVHDGSLAEWMVPNASLTKDDFLRESFVRHPDEFSFNVYMAWSAAEHDSRHRG